MDEEGCLLNADRMKLIVATMTKNYNKAIDIGKSILRSEPGDTMVQEYLSALKNKTQRMQLMHSDSDTNDSGSEISDDTTTEDASSDSSTDNSCREIYDNKNGQDHNIVERKEFCRGFGKKDKVFDYRRHERTSRDPRHNDHCLRNNKTTINSNMCNELKDKIIRVLPIRLRLINK